jgi:DNA repair protein RadC
MTKTESKKVFKEARMTIRETEIQYEAAQIKYSAHVKDIALKIYEKSGNLAVLEEFHILCLNRANRILNTCKISQGGIAGTVVDIRFIAVMALASGASSVILIHNHPSGNINPSQGDRQVTDKIASALKLLDINVLDHCILGQDIYGAVDYYSFADRGLI